MTTKKETNVAVKEEQTTDLAMPSGAWGNENARASDMIIPRISILQKTSKMLEKESLGAKIGEFRDSMTQKLLGSRSKPLKFIPIFMTNTWVKLEAKGNKFVGVTTRTAANEDTPFEETVEGKIYRNIKSLNVFCLLPDELEKKEAFPYVISFQATGFQTGRKLITMVKKLEMMGKPLAAKNFILTSETRTNDSGTWDVFLVEQGEDTKMEHLKTAFQWYKTVSQGNVKVDEGADESADGGTVPTDTGQF